MTIIAIKNTNISTEKIAAITYAGGALLIDVGGPEPFDWNDPDGALYDSAMKQWREYLADRQSRWLEAIQYGIVLAANRGSMA